MNGMTKCFVSFQNIPNNPKQSDIVLDHGSNQTPERDNGAKHSTLSGLRLLPRSFHTIKRSSYYAKSSYNHRNHVEAVDGHKWTASGQNEK